MRELSILALENKRERTPGEGARACGAALNVLKALLLSHPDALAAWSPPGLAPRRAGGADEGTLGLVCSVPQRCLTIVVSVLNVGVNSGLGSQYLRSAPQRRGAPCEAI